MGQALKRIPTRGGALPAAPPRRADRLGLFTVPALASIVAAPGEPG